MQAYAVLSRIWEAATEYGQRELLDEIKADMTIPEEFKELFK
jgi:hypothetical protein